jgi:hypothetical protein
MTNAYGIKQALLRAGWIQDEEHPEYWWSPIDEKAYNKADAWRVQQRAEKRGN